MGNVVKNAKIWTMKQCRKLGKINVNNNSHTHMFGTQQAEYNTDCKICFEVVFIPACRKCNLHALINVEVSVL
jgi:hypothetical protein